MTVSCLVRDSSLLVFFHVRGSKTLNIKLKPRPYPETTRVRRPANRLFSFKSLLGALVSLIWERTPEYLKQSIKLNSFYTSFTCLSLLLPTIQKLAYILPVSFLRRPRTTHTKLLAHFLFTVQQTSVRCV